MISSIQQRRCEKFAVYDAIQAIDLSLLAYICLASLYVNLITLKFSIILYHLQYILFLPINNSLSVTDFYVCIFKFFFFFPCARTTQFFFFLIFFNAIQNKKNLTYFNIKCRSAFFGFLKEFN